MVAAKKMDAARAAVASFERQFPQSPQTRLLRACLLAKDGKVCSLSVVSGRSLCLPSSQCHQPCTRSARRTITLLSASEHEEGSVANALRRLFLLRTTFVCSCCSFIVSSA